MRFIKSIEMLDNGHLTVTGYISNIYEVHLDDPDRCPSCHSKNIRIEHSNYKKDLIDIIIKAMGNHAIKLRVIYNYFRCNSTMHKGSKFFPSSFCFSWNKRPYTCRFELFVFKQCLIRPAKSVADSKDMNGLINPHDAIGIFSHVTKLLDSYMPTKIAPIITMEIHKTVIKGVTLFVICNIEKGTLVDILTDCQSKTLIAFSKRMPVTSLKTIWIDIDNDLLVSVKSAFPFAKICTGKREIHRYFKSVIPKISKNLGAKKRYTNSALRELDLDYMKRSDDTDLGYKELYDILSLDTNLGNPKQTWASKAECDTWVLSALKRLPHLCEINSTFMLFNDYGCFSNSVEKSYLDSSGHDLKDDVDDLLTSIGSRVIELRRTKASIIRARTLYGSIILDTKEISLNDMLKATKRTSYKTMLEMSCLYYDNLLYGKMTFVRAVEETIRMFLGDSFIIEQLDELSNFETNNNRGKNRPYDSEQMGKRLSGPEYSESWNNCWLVGQPLSLVDKNLEEVSKVIKSTENEEKNNYC